MPLDAHPGAPRPFARPLPAESARLAAPHSAEDLTVLARTCWAEPIGGTLRGMEVVAATALNFWRARRPFDPHLTIAAVCQDFGRFECWEWAAPPPSPKADDPRYAMARRAARRALNYGPFLGQAIDPAAGAAGYVRQSLKAPDWTTGLKPFASSRGLKLYGAETARPFLAIDQKGAIQ